MVIISCSDPSEQTPAIVIQNVTAIDAANGSRTGQTVIIRGKKVTEIGPTAEIDLPSNATVIDGTGKFLIPGLWDAHVHLTYEEELTPVMFDLFLVNGVTSIRDTGGLLEKVMPVKALADKDDGSSPRVMVAGPLLDGVPTVYNGEGNRPKIGLGAANPEEAVRLVQEFNDAGVDLIKSYEMLTPESFEAVLSKAKELNKLVTGHVPLSMDVIEASNLGLNSMEHLRNLEMACSGDFDSLLNARRELLENDDNLSGGELRSSIHEAQRYYAIANQDDDRTREVLGTLAINQTWQIPTLTILAAMQNRVFDRLAWRNKYKYLPDSVESRWSTYSKQIAQIPTDQNAIDYANWGFNMIRKLDEAEVPIMAGTDTPIFFLTPGYSLHEELRLLVNAGLSPIRAIEAATLAPARYFGIENELGTIEPGKYADLVLLDANPIVDINNTRSINSVVKSGKLMSRTDLDGILQKLASN